MKAIKIVLAALAALMVLGEMGMAATSTADITITATVGEGIAITTPGSFAWNLGLGANTKNAGNLVVASNVPIGAGTTLSVSVADTDTVTHQGYLTDNTNTLAAPLYVVVDSGTPAALTSSQTIASTASTPDTHTYAIGFTQAVSYSDVVSSGYAKTLRFNVVSSA